MPLLEIEKIYQSEKEIREYENATKNLENWRFVENCIWDINFPEILNKVKIRDRKFEAWNRLYGFLDDLTSEEWVLFNEAIQRRPLFEKNDINDE